MMMLAPDLLDRRALALLALTDAFGNPVTGPVEVVADGVRSCAKTGGRIAILAAPGLSAHVAAFLAAPASPALRSRVVPIDLFPADRMLMPRRVNLRLPRDPDPANREDARSLFKAEQVVFSASPLVRMEGSACVVRASVRRAGDGALVGNALVRAQSAGGAHSAWAQTDIAGEAALVFRTLPLSFTRPGGGISAEIDAAVVVHADPVTATFTTPDQLLAARREAAAQRTMQIDPDTMAAAFPPAFAAGVSVQLAVNTQTKVALQWTAP